ncbi:MAG TPA: adenylyltransferase/cytidyltransferase family protein [Candidatus Thermoplasmatota archaeon]
MVRVMATGVFDLLHPGHLHFLRSAKELGDELVVVVATDVMVRRRKHEPVTPQEMRRELVEGLKPVDRAVVGREDDIYKTVEEVRPDIIALGYDQSFREEDIRAELERRGLGHIRVVRLSKQTSGYDLDGTRKIIAKVEQGLSFQRRIEKVEGTPAGPKEGQGGGGSQRTGEGG